MGSDIAAATAENSFCQAVLLASWGQPTLALLHPDGGLTWSPFRGAENQRSEAAFDLFDAAQVERRPAICVNVQG